MGQGQSTPRRVTVINDEVTGVIKISDSVVRRLKEEMTSQVQSSADRGSQGEKATSDEPHASQGVPRQESASAEGVDTMAPPAMTPGSSHAAQETGAVSARPLEPQIRFIEGPSLSALKVRAEKEAELKHVESYWQGRVQKLREHQLKSTEIEEESFRATVEAVDKMFLKLKNEPICQAARREVEECFSLNKTKTLLCSQQVQAFANCVQAARLSALGRGG